MNWAISLEHSDIRFVKNSICIFRKEEDCEKDRLES